MSRQRSCIIGPDPREAFLGVCCRRPAWTNGPAQRSGQGLERLPGIPNRDMVSIMRQPQLLDLFCGAGGISHGFREAGFAVVGGIDFDRDSVQTFAANHPGSKAICADLSTTSPEALAEIMPVPRGELDCMAGGPPCQGFSRNRAFRHDDDGAFVDDPRNHLYWHFFEYVEHFRPKVVLMENVPEILIKMDGAFRDAVFERFHSLGYEAEARVLNAANYGVPQLRRRAIFVAGRDGHRIALPEPSTEVGRRAGNRTPTSQPSIPAKRPTNGTLPLFGVRPDSPTVWDAISDIQGSYADTLHGVTDYATPPQNSYQAELRGNQESVANHFRWQLSERQLQRIRLLSQGQGVEHLPASLKPKGAYGSAYRRLQADALALTITTWMFHPGSGMFTHPFEDRVLTIREAARIQSFQDAFVFTGSYHSQCRQVGNSVAPKLAASLARTIAVSLGCRLEPGSPASPDNVESQSTNARL